MEFLGSSPRVRGKQTRHPRRRGPLGLIPACAGKTPCLTICSLTRQAHPRVCGENPRQPINGCAQRGSSPRVRGKRPRRRKPKFGCGLIPACAGKTSQRGINERANWAHPRVCGENNVEQEWIAFTRGSSPRVRGKRGGDGSLMIAERLIPACAGKTRAPTRGRFRFGAHPRVCGENFVPAQGSNLGAGSSPRVRGKRVGSPSAVCLGGLIPACAGKTQLPAQFACSLEAHPRVCGENPACPPTSCVSKGSSPRVRGKRSYGDRRAGR